MQITRLEIFGFKSFLERFVLDFNERLIGVVGPNGCGKSNIVDALRWVLGETHARQLRGVVLDDIIFNGSESRRPLGLAEVTITIRPDEGWKERVLADLAVLPGTEAPSGEPQDGTEAVAKWNSDEEDKTDEEDLQTEPAINREGLLSSLASAVPGLFEATELQLTRRLYRSGESEYFINRVPCRLRDLADLYRLLGLGPRGLSIVQQGQIGEIISKKPVELRELLEEAAGISGFRVRLEAAQRQLERTAENMARLSDIIIEVEKQVSVLRRQAKRARERNKLKEEIRSLDISLISAKAVKLQLQQRELARELQQLEEALADGRQKLIAEEQRETQIRVQIEQDEHCIDQFRLEREGVQKKLLSLRSERQEKKLRVTELAGKEQGARERLRLFSERLTLLETEQEAHVQGAAKARAAAAALQERLRNLSSLRVSKEGEYAEIAQLASQVTTLQEKVLSLRHDADDKRLHLARVETELSTLSSQLEALAELGQGAEGPSDERQKTLFAEFIRAEEGKVLLTGARVPEELQRAVAAVLGERAMFYVLADLERAHEFYDLQLADTDHSLGFLSSEADSFTELEPLENALYPRLLSRLEIKESFVRIYEALIGHVYLVDTLSAARSFVAACRAQGREVLAVTPAGEVCAGWGFYVSAQKGAIFSFTRVLDERRQESVALQLCLQELSKELSVAEQELQLAQTRRKELEFKRENDYRAEVSRVSAELAREETVQAAEAKRLTELEGEIQQLKQQHQATSAEFATITEELLALSEAGTADEAGAEPNENGLIQAAEGIRENLTVLEAARNSERETLKALVVSLAERRSRVEELSNQLTELKLRGERFVIERDVLQQELQVNYGEGLSLPDESSAQEVLLAAGGSLPRHIEELQTKAFRLKHRLEREGEVDPQSIELYETEFERLNKMRTQQLDLQSAAETLNRTIKQLKEISRNKFVGTYVSVNERFQQLIPRLFGGGTGFLELINPSDPLASGVQITVKPPGKKLRNLEMLSGGEKAISAVALLIAMFLHRPSPICVLDEVDAPLDDANIERFLEIIKNISLRTSFVVITHNPKTMSAMDRLVGITMQEKGVTRALQVSLEAAVEELEHRAVG